MEGACSAEGEAYFLHGAVGIQDAVQGGVYVAFLVVLVVLVVDRTAGIAVSRMRPARNAFGLGKKQGDRQHYRNAT